MALDKGAVSKNGREPDWGRFGLDDERQPLNPGGVENGVSGDTTNPDNKDFYGGQAQNKNELFAQDQNSTAPPWWLSHFLVSERTLFGTWDGVFTSCLINIFGVIVFLRTGWIVAEAGIGHAALIVLAAVALILVAVLAAIGICERCHVQSGGVYFLISHVLGARRGAAIGIMYIFGQAIGNALCATGFGESIAGVIAGEKDGSPWVERIVAAAVIIFLTLINLAGVKWVVRLQFALLVVLLLGAADFGIGSFSHTDPDNGFYGWNMTVWRNNSKPSYTEHHNWFSVFGVFFPALTGVMAGINMSGDLKNPSQDISVGTLSAVALGFMSSDDTEQTQLLKSIYCTSELKALKSDKDNTLIIMAHNDVETDTSIQRQISGRRVMRFIPEVTADNLPSRIRLEPRNLGSAASLGNSVLRKDNATQFAASKIASVVHDKRSKIELTSVSGDVSEKSFGNAVRGGNERRVNNILKSLNKDNIEKHLLAQLSFDLTLDRDTSFDESNARDEGDGSGVPDIDKVNMTVTIFQLGIIAKRPGIIKMFMQKVLDETEGQECLELLKKLLGTQAFLTFTKNSEVYDKDDRALDGMNAFHLGAKYSPASLAQIFEHLDESAAMEEVDLSELLEAPENQLNQTPLHIAAAHSAGGSYSTAARILVENGANVNAVNYQGFTPLHIASKWGNDNIVSMLLENDAEPSKPGHRLKTPLHKAKTAKVVQILLNNGANPYAKATDKTDVNGHPSQTVFDTLLYRHSQATQDLMTECIDTNGQDLDSSDLLVVYDLELFRNESIRGFDMEPDEMASHKKIIDIKDDSVLQHPLSEVMLYMKKFRIAKFYDFNILVYLFFLFVFTTLVLLQVLWLKDFDQTDKKWNGNLSISEKCRSAGIWESMDQRCCFWYREENRKNLTNQTDPGIKCGMIFLNEWDENGNVICDDNLLSPGFYAFYTFYFSSVFMTAILIVKEVSQIFYNWEHYWTTVEEFLEIGQYLVASAYLVGIFFLPRVVNLHLAAWSVLLIWCDMTLLLGRIPSIGIYVYMWTHVLKTMIKVLVVFVPTLAAFSLAFYVLLPTNEAFNDPVTAVLKSIAMMVGELDFVDNFTVDKSGDSEVTLQLMFLLFVIFVSIIIANLIIGLTVSEIDDLYNEARAIRLHKMVTQLVNLEDLFINKPSITDCLPSSVRTRMRHVTSLFSYLENLKISKDNKTIKGSSTSPWKLCVRPFAPKRKINKTAGGVVEWVGNKFFKKRTVTTDNNIFFYDEVKGSIGTEIGYSLPTHIVTNTIALLEEREKKITDQVMQLERTADSVKVEKMEANKIEKFSEDMSRNSMRRKSALPNRPISPYMSRKNSFTRSSMEPKHSNNVPGTPKNKRDLEVEELENMKEMMLKMVKSVDDIKNRIEEKETSNL